MTSRFMMHVPLPATTVRVGYQALASGCDGFSAVTHGHVWMTALAGSTLSAECDGALRLISTDDHVLGIAKTSVLHATTGGIGVASGGGIRVIAGHAADPDLSPPDGPVDRPDALDGVTRGCDEVTTAWQAANLAINVLFAAKAAGMAVLGGPANARIGGDVALIAQSFASVSKLATASTEVAALSGADVPGINMHGTGGINLFSPMFASMYGMAGTIFASPYSAQVFGAATVGIVGLATAGISSVGKADLSSSGGVSVVSSGPVQVKSMPGEVVMKGSTVALGQVLPDKDVPAQVLTADVGFTTIAGLRLKSPKGNVRLGRVPYDLVAESKILAAVDSLESVSDALDLDSSASLLETLGGLKTLALAPRDVPKALNSIQAPEKDPIFTLNNEVKVVGGAVVLVKDSVKMQVGDWIVMVNKDGIMLGSSKTKADEEGDPPPAPDMPQVNIKPDELTMTAGPAGPKLDVGTDSITIQGAAEQDKFQVAGFGITFKGNVTRLS